MQQDIGICSLSIDRLQFKYKYAKVKKKYNYGDWCLFLFNKLIREDYFLNKQDCVYILRKDNREVHCI